MVEFIKVTAKVPTGETKEYMFMGDLDKHNDQGRLIKFMEDCCHDCADFYIGICPDEFDVQDWYDGTMAMW